MKSKSEVELRTLRGLLNEFTNDNVAKRRKPDEELSDESVLEVIAREAKKRRESIEQFEKGGREDLADSERKELAILEEFLPEQMSEEDIKKIVEEKMSELAVSGKDGMGKLMGALMKDLQGRANGKIVKKIIEDLLNN